MAENTTVLNVWNEAEGKYVGLPVLKGNKGEKGDKGDRGDRGFSGLVPLKSRDSAPNITVEANTVTTINTLSCDTEISLGDAVSGYDNEWIFTIAQGETAYSVTLPEIEWSLGVAPAFLSNSITEIRLHFKGNTLCGVWC